MKSSYNDIRNRFANDPQIIKHLDVFLEAKEKYIITRDIQDRIDLKMKYVDIYEDIKCAWYCHRYSEDVFNSYKECLSVIE